MNEELGSALLRISPFILLITVISLFLRLKRFSRSDLQIQPPVSWLIYAGWCLSFLLFIAVTEVVMLKIGLLKTDSWQHPFLPSIIRITGAVILAPVAEELFFRGLLLFRLEQLKIRRPIIIVIQAILFVISHHFAYENTMESNIAVVQTLVDATLYACARYHTKSLLTPITMHMSGNIIATLERFIL